MALFTIPERQNSRVSDNAIAKKVNSASVKAPITVKGGGGLITRIQTIIANVEKNLGKYRDKYIAIQDEETLKMYIDKAIEVNMLSIDTETTGLDPLLDEIAGPCIFVPGLKGAYIPINHVSYMTGAKLPNQLSIEVVRREFQRAIDAKVFIVMFNAAFDIRVMRNKIGVKNIYCNWDCYLAQRLLNENEESNALKKIHQKYVLNGEEDAFKFDDLFKGIPFTLIPISTAYLYAAHDPDITYELYLYQKQYLREDIDREDLRKIYWVFKNIEMPLVDVIVDMEDAGVKFDFEYNAKLKEKYHALLNERELAFHKVCAKYKDEIQAYRNAHLYDCKLETPINIGSTSQLAILLYDILGCDLPIDKVTRAPKRSTAEDALKQLDCDVAKAVLEYREFSTIVSTFIDKLPDCVNPNDGRIHCKFNQYGADTGRMSSSDPNLQNIPSHITDIRKMFTASDNSFYISETTDNTFEVASWTELKTDTGWKSVNHVNVGDKLYIEGNDTITVSKIDVVDKNRYLIYYS